MRKRFLCIIAVISLLIIPGCSQEKTAGATALATGFKTTNQVVAMDMNGNEFYRTVLEKYDGWDFGLGDWRWTCLL